MRNAGACGFSTKQTKCQTSVQNVCLTLRTVFQMIRPVNYRCQRCGKIKELWINTKVPRSEPCCDRLMVPIEVQPMGYRTDHTWDEGT